MVTKRSYWLAQILGWSFYVLTELLGYIMNYKISFRDFNQLMGNFVINAVIGILLTHVFRIYFKKFNWIKLPIYQLLFRCVVVVVLITLVLVALNIPLDQLLLNTGKVNWVLRDINYMTNNGKPVFIWMLIYVFYSYTNERKNDAIERLKLESSVKETEAKILRAQMNPHFMFNALNSIRALVLEDPTRAQQGITQLSNILRSSLIADRRKTVALHEELKTVADYLALEKVRYEERLQIKWDVDDNTLGVQVPPMMLQTLVENAIKHGVQKAIRWGFIEINTTLQDKKLLIRIRNTGHLDHIQHKHTDASGFGLENTIQRLRLLYGEEAKFAIFQEDELTVSAEIILPLNSSA